MWGACVPACERACACACLSACVSACVGKINNIDIKVSLKNDNGSARLILSAAQLESVS